MSDWITLKVEIFFTGIIHPDAFLFALMSIVKVFLKAVKFSFGHYDLV